MSADFSMEQVSKYMNWKKGPLGFLISDDWHYWLPLTASGVYRVFYNPLARDEALLGETEILEDAKDLCVRHQRKECGCPH